MSMANLEKYGNELLYVGFNQDYGCFSVGTNTGFRIYNCDPFKETFKRGFNKGGIGYVEMLFRCNILALVGGGKNPRFPPNKVMIWDDHQNRCIGELSFRSKVRAVKLRRDRVVVVLEFKIYVYNFADLKLLDQIETISNPKGLCALCPYTPSTVLVCPAIQKGHVRCELYDTGKTTFIPAHESNLAALALNSDGTRVATASDKGTLVRVWSTATGALLQELRRGSDRADIYCLTFSPTTEWLACSSDKGTVHIFSLTGARTPGKTESKSAPLPPGGSPEPEPRADGRLEERKEARPDGKDPRKNPTSTFSILGSLLPTKYFASEWSFAQYKVPDTGQTVVAFGDEKHSIVVVSSDGVFYKATFDPEKPNTPAVQSMYTKFIKDAADELAEAAPP